MGKASRTSQRGGGAAAAFTHTDFYIELSHESLKRTPSKNMFENL